MRQILTRPKIEAALKNDVPQGKAYADLKDAKTSGLTFRIRPTGANAWLFIYRPRGAGRSAAPRALRLGSYPALTLEDARLAAAKYAGQVAQGADPQIEARTAAQTTALSVGDAIDIYRERLIVRKIVKPAEVISSLRRGLSAALRRPLAELTRRDLTGFIERIEVSGRLGAAAGFRRYLTAFLNSMLEAGHIPYNPLAGMRRPRRSRAEIAETAEKGRALTSDEVSRLWHACDIANPLHAIVRIGLLTGLRRKELAEMEWSFIKDDRIILPARLMKNGDEHHVPITPLLRNLLASIPRRSETYVFPSRITGRPMQGWSKLVPNLSKEAGVKFTLHDLRRTFRTILSDLGFETTIAEAAIAHRQDDLIRRYDKSGLWTQRQKAAVALSDHIERLVTDKTDTSTATIIAIGGRS